MVKLPQNIQSRMEAAGKTVDSYLTDKASKLQLELANAKSIINVNGVADSVAGVIGDFESALVDPETNVSTKFTEAFPKATNIFDNLLGGLFNGPPFPNPLRKFSSMNYILGLGVLSNTEINFPDLTYRRRDPNIMIARSGGGLENKASTFYEKNGQTEYFIDDLNVDLILGSNPKTKQTNAVAIDFKITEPYSMGLFLQTLQIAALQAGHKNYLAAPYIITIGFKGWDDNGNPISSPDLRRFVPIKIVDLNFEVTEGGSEYQVTAIPWNEQAFTNQIQSTKSDIRVTGKTVAEILQTGGFSVSASYNQREQEKKKDKQVKTPDEFVILFPKSRSSAEEQLLVNEQDDEGATTGEERELNQDEKQQIYDSISGTENGQMPADFDAELSKLLGIVIKRSSIGESIREFAQNPENLNQIGQAKLVESYLDGGKQPFGRPKFTEVDGKEGVFERGKITVSNNLRDLTFASGTKIQTMIEEIVLLSEYGKRIAETEPDENGMIPYFRVETDVYNITDHEQMDMSGEYPKVYVYRVLEYMAHISHYAPPTKSGIGYKSLEKQVCKEYDYIYTGKNDDILEFDIKIDKAFFTAIQPFGGAHNFGPKSQEQNKTAGDNDNQEYEKTSGDTDNLSSSGNASSGEDDSPGSGETARGGLDDRTSTSVARDFNDAIVNSNVDLFSVRMKILGDPYYIADSGLGNYSSGTTPLINLTQDGTLDYQSSEIHVALNFRTPLDYGSDGWMDFPGLGTQPVGAFSGLYRVLYVYNTFNQGVFSQELYLLRMRNQEGKDTKIAGTTTDNVALKPKQQGESKGGTGGTADTNETIAKGQEAGKGYRGGYGF